MVLEKGFEPSRNNPTVFKTVAFYLFRHSSIYYFLIFFPLYVDVKAWQFGHKICKLFNSLLVLLPSLWCTSNGIGNPFQWVLLQHSHLYSFNPSRNNFFLNLLLWTFQILYILCNSYKVFFVPILILTLQYLIIKWLIDYLITQLTYNNSITHKVIKVNTFFKIF